MEDKKLNFNRPLLSVRRFSPTIANSQKESRRKNESSIPALLPCPSYKSELHSGPLRKPGTVPFVWEQSPGKPKDERKTQKQIKERSLVVPKLPPGRILKPKKQDLHTITEEFNVKNISGNDSFERSIYLKNHGDVNGENEKPRIMYGPNFLELNDDDNEEDSESDYDDHGNMSNMVCGLLPHFCLKGSIGLLNPIPGLSVRTRLPIANRTRAGSSSASSHSSEGRELSNNLPESSPPLISEKKEINLQKKGLVSFKELLTHENENEKEADPLNPTIEKTLYVDTIHKVETFKSYFNENNEGIFGISHIPTESLKSDLHAVDKLKEDKKMITPTGICKVKEETVKSEFNENDEGIFGISHIPAESFKSKVDQKVKGSRQSGYGLELPAPPPLPKSPSDSWLWRTLPSVSSKTASSWSNRKYSSNTTEKLDKNVQSRYPQGLLLPIPET